MREQSRAVTALKGTVLVLVSLLVMALVLEGVLRLLDRVRAPAVPVPQEAAAPEEDGDEEVGLTVPDPLLAWSFRPSAEGTFKRGAHPTQVVTNELGLRSPSVAALGDSGVRILVLGDSYGFGWGVDESDCFPRLLESKLRERHPGAGVAVINASAPGYGLYQQTAMFEKVRETVEVDVVVSTYSLANDPLDDLRILRFAPDRLLKYSPQLVEKNGVVRWFIRHSALVRLVDHRTSGLQFKMVNTSSEATEASELCMRALFSTLGDHGIRVVQVQIPQRWEVKDRAGADLLKASTKPVREMRERVASEFGVLSVDAARALLDLEESTGDAYLSNDAHWTPAGHDAVAEVILDALPPDWFIAER
ncbi:MAG: GDSL-type esterase/lipase family protein [Candidatus Eisenbacteria bacterium]